MPGPISNDSTIGSRFWLVTDFSIMHAPNGVDAPANPSGVKHDSNILSFAKSVDDPMTRSAINRATLFAASHTLSLDQRNLETARARMCKFTLLGEDQGEAFLAQTVAEFADRFGEDGTQFCRTALDKLMASQEFYERATCPNATGVNPQLGPAGLASLKNAVLGLANMLRNNQITPDAVLILADGNYYDAANRSDLLRLAAKSTQKVKELFIGKDRFESLINQCQRALAHMEATGTGAAEECQAIRQRIARLRTLAATAINLREQATVLLKTDYLLTDSTGAEKSDKAFQKKQLDKIRDSLRAFRFDLDSLRGVDMSRMTFVRRKFDNWFSSIGSQNRITAERYQAMCQADRQFNRLLEEVQNQVAPGAVQEDGSQLDLGGRVDLETSIRKATHLSHLTNDRIRYHYSGAEKRAQEHLREIQAELGSIAESGGQRTVTFRGGADMLFDLNLVGAQFQAKAGLEAEISANIKVNEGDGTVSVTYTYGGNIGGAVSTQVGVDPNQAGGKSGLGAKLSGKAAFGVGKKVTKTYASLDDLAQNMSRLNMVMTPRTREAFYAWGKSAIRGVGHFFLAGATLFGFRIHRSRMDDVGYGAELRKRNVFGPLGGVFLRKRNVAMVSERKAMMFKGNAQVGADAGIYHDGDGDKPTSNFQFGGALGGSYSRELTAKGKTYESFANSLANCTAAYLQQQFNQALQGKTDAWFTSLRQIILDMDEHNGAQIAEALAKLTDRLTRLEDSGAGEKDTPFWEDFSAKARLIALATALLTKRAEALDNTAPENQKAKDAAKAAGEYIIPRLVNPVVKMPQSIYQSQFFNVANVTEPRTSRKELTLVVQYNALNAIVGEGLEKLGMGDNAQQTAGEKFGPQIAPGNTAVHNALDAVAQVGEPTLQGAADIGKDTFGLSGKYELRIISENVVSQHRDPRPWLNTGKRFVEVRMHANLPMRIILDAIARHYVSQQRGLDDAQRQELEKKWKQEFKDGLIDGFKMAGEDAIISGTDNLFDLPFLEAAKKYPVVGQLIGGASFINKLKEDETYLFQDDTFKTLRFEFSEDWRFSNFTLAEEYDTKATLDFKVVPFISLHASLESKTSVNDWVVMPKPTPNTLMKQAANYNAAGNPEGFATFLANSRKGVVRLVKAGAANPPGHPDDSKWQGDCTKMQQLMDDCQQRLTRLVQRGGRAEAQASALRQSFVEMVEEMRNQPADLNDEDALDLAERFFTATAKIYTIDAMTQGEGQAA
ncbi:MAG: hypothetical protein IJJ33_12850 [Victivallales bacterium]|nr:hypothetical protein [Victivallales bacterium]